MVISERTFERWLCYLNICISILIIAFVTVPEMLIGAKAEEKAYKVTFFHVQTPIYNLKAWILLRIRMTA